MSNNFDLHDFAANRKKNGVGLYVADTHEGYSVCFWCLDNVPNDRKLATFNEYNPGENFVEVYEVDAEEAIVGYSLSSNGIEYLSYPIFGDGEIIKQ